MEGADFAKNMMAHTLTFHHSHTETWMTYTHSLKVIHVSAQIFNICLHLDLMIPYQILHQVDPSSGGHNFPQSTHGESFFQSLNGQTEFLGEHRLAIFVLITIGEICLQCENDDWNVKMMPGM